MEETVDPLLWDADARVPDGEVQLVYLRAPAVALDGALDSTDSTTSPSSVNLTAFVRRLARIWPSRVASPTSVTGALGSSREAKSRRCGCATRSRAASNRVAEDKGTAFELELAGLDLRQVEDVVDDPEQGIAARADHLGEPSLLRR